MNPSPISVVVVNFNGMPFIKKCMKSVLNQSKKPHEIILIDNLSKDGSLDFIKNDYPEIKIIENNYNAGFCKSANQGINLAEGEYIAVLNVDVELEEKFFEEIFKTIPSDKKIGIITGKILRMGIGVSQKVIDSAGQFIGKDLRPKERGYKEIDSGKYNVPGFIFSACAACCIYKKDMLNDIKINREYFDEDLFSYCEDFDLAWRAYYKGWKTYYVPTAVCRHVRGGSFFGDYKWSIYELPKKPLEIQKHIIANRYIVLIKNAPIKLILRQLFYIVKYEIFLLGYLVLFHFSLLFMIFLNVKKQLNKRKLLKQYWSKQAKSEIYRWII